MVNSAAAFATRGSFHRPDPKPYGLYKYTRRTHMEDVNTILYSDFAPEFHMHLHSI
jgi:ribosomal protein L20A (L18A)